MVSHFNKYSLLLLLMGLTLAIKAQNQNYRITSSPLVETQDLSSLQDDKKGVVKEILDDFGQPLFTIYSQKSPGKKDLIEYFEHDALGRLKLAWLPVPYSNATDNFTADDFIAASTSFYNDSKPYNENIYEPFMLERLSKEAGPGDDWNNRGIDHSFQINSKDTKYSCLRYGILLGDNLKCYGTYASNELTIQTVTDEDGHSKQLYHDRSGNLVLERMYCDSEKLDTYFVRDDYNNLCYVLPPLASEVLTSTSIYYTMNNSDVLKQYAYSYKYDSYNRCIEKKLPGAEPVFYVYDMNDRLTLSQDGNQRTRGVWTVYKYDRFGRTAYTCEAEIAETFASLRNTISKQKVVENFNTQSQPFPMEDTGYSRALFPSATTTLLTVNYYDDYSFLDILPATVKTGLTYQDNNDSDPRYENARGLLTGTRIYNVGGLGGYKVTAFYYDYKGNVVQQLATNHLQGFDKEYYQYSFTGKPLNYVHEHSVPEKTGIRQTYIYNYDHADRLLKTQHSTDGSQFCVLALNRYDELGRLSLKVQSGTETVKYSYNIRNWITEINTANGSLHESIDYVPYYNGNIGSIRWNVGKEAYDRQYFFKYDGLSRIKQASYVECTMMACKPNSNYDVEIGSYDKQGNIRQLIRKGMTSSFATLRIAGEYPARFGIIDNLTLNYNGNQLKNISDAAVADPVYKDAMHFVDGADQEVEYTYDKNGNMVSDLNKGIENIAYNIVNQPERVRFKQVLAESSGIVSSNTYNRGVTAYIYDAAGVKLRTTYITETEKVVSPGGYPVGTSKINSITDYCGNIIYENGVVSKVLIPDGYLTPAGTGFTYHFYIKDHQGNVRAVMNRSRQIEQANHYYPFGGLFAASTAGAVQNYKYSGKELDRMNGLDLYDFSARAQDPMVGRFTSIDLFCEKYYSISPYAYCANNPIKYVDPDGRKIVIGTLWQRIMGKLGLDPYVSRVSEQLQQNNMDSRRIESTYNQLEKSDLTYTILPLSESPINKPEKIGNHVIPDSKVERGKKQGGTMYYDAFKEKNESGEERNPRIGLAHEMGHLEDLMNGDAISTDNKKAKSGHKIEMNKVEFNEKNSMELENIIRGILNYTIRNNYFKTK